MRHIDSMVQRLGWVLLIAIVLVSPVYTQIKSSLASVLTAVVRDKYGSAHVYDKGAQVYNVKAYGANGTGGDDNTAIALALSTCEDSTYGGKVFFPFGIYGITSAKTLGNGSSFGSGVASSKATCMLEGVGSNSEVGGGWGSIIKWVGSNPGSNTYMLTMDGPIISGGGIKNLSLDCNSNANLLGLDLRQVVYHTFENITVQNCGGGTAGGAFSLKLWPQKSHGYYACFNTFINVRVRPYLGSGGSALWVGGNSSVGTACGNTFVGGYFNRDNDWSSGANVATYSILLDSADNDNFYRVHFDTTGGNNARNGCSIGAAVSPFNAAYPDSAGFYGIASGGACGTTGGGTDGRPFVFMAGGECGGGGSGSCDFTNAFTGGGTKPISLQQEANGNRAFKGVSNIVTSYNASDPDFGDIQLNHNSGAQNGAGNITFARQAEERARIVGDYVYGFQYRIKNGSSGTVSERFRMVPDGTAGPSALAAVTSPPLCYNSGVVSGINLFSTCSSLAKYKTDVFTLKDALETVLRLRPVTYTSLTGGLRKELGFIAEEVETIEPRLSTYAGDGTLVGVDYGHASAIAIGAIQELHQRIEVLESEVKELRRIR